MPADPPVVDPDDPSTWPASVGQLVERWNGAVAATKFWEDLELPDDAQAALVDALAGHRLRAYHCTRLLDHEMPAVREQGLRVFGRELFDDRVATAAGHRAFGEHERVALLRGHMYGCGEARSRRRREGQVCLVIGRSVFDHDPDRVSPLLSSWGGEGIYFSSGVTGLQPLLRSLGTPTVVVTALPLQRDRRRMRWFPPLPRLFLAIVRGLPASGDLFHSGPVPADAIVDLWQPGHADYDRHPRLPTS